VRGARGNSRPYRDRADIPCSGPLLKVNLPPKLELCGKMGDDGVR